MRKKDQRLTGGLSTEEQKNLILDQFLDGHDPENFLALVDHCKIDLAACNGDKNKITNVILAHYRISKGRYDIDRAAQNLLTFPPVARRIAELKSSQISAKN